MVGMLDQWLGIGGQPAWAGLDAEAAARGEFDPANTPRDTWPRRRKVAPDPIAEWGEGQQIGAPVSTMGMLNTDRLRLPETAAPQLTADMGDPSGAGMPPTTNDAYASEPIVFKNGDVPIPKAQPVVPTTEAPQATGDATTPPNATPTMQQGQVNQSPPFLQQNPGLFGGMLGNLFRPENAPLFLSLGAMAGQPSLGAAIRGGSTAAVPAAMQLQQNQLKEGYINHTYQAMIKRGVPEEVARAAAGSPEMLKQILPSIMGSKKLMNVNGVLVDEATGQKVADYSEAQKWQIAKVTDPKTGEETSVLLQPSTGATKAITPANLQKTTGAGGAATANMTLPPEVRNLPPSMQFHNAPDGSTGAINGRPVIRRGGRWEYTQ